MATGDPASANPKAVALGWSSVLLDRAASMKYLGWRGRRLPVVREQFTGPGNRVRGDSRQHVTEPSKRLDAAPIAEADEASQHRRLSCRPVAAEEGSTAMASAMSRFAREGFCIVQ
jgi:hypothetical protein